MVKSIVKQQGGGGERDDESPVLSNTTMYFTTSGTLSTAFVNNFRAKCRMTVIYWDKAIDFCTQFVAHLIYVLMTEVAFANFVYLKLKSSL